MHYTKRLIQEIGLEPERLEMFNMSSSMATAFVEAVEEMTRRAQELGPSPIREGRASKKSSSQRQQAAS